MRIIIFSPSLKRIMNSSISSSHHGDESITTRSYLFSYYTSDFPPKQLHANYIHVYKKSKRKKSDSNSLCADWDSLVGMEIITLLLYVRTIRLLSRSNQCETNLCSGEAFVCTMIASETSLCNQICVENNCVPSCLFYSMSKKYRENDNKSTTFNRGDFFFEKKITGRCFIVKNFGFYRKLEVDFQEFALL